MAEHPLDRPIVAICAGKDCRRRDEFTPLRRDLRGSCDVVELSCIGICKGPVVVADPTAARPRVYSKLRSARDRSLVVSLATGDRAARRVLAPRRTKKAKTIVRVQRQVRRRVA